MAMLVEASLWIDLTRARSPLGLKQFVAPYIDDPEASIAEPIVFELLRSATDAEARRLKSHFDSLPRLTDPDDLWRMAAELGQSCRKNGINVGALDLLIATVAIHHGAELVTFDGDFERIARVSALQVKLLQRPTP
ncbi:MAG: type II toxin-antitoxin system VapC family toxin [Candidatus Acidiferrum sp.]